MLLENVKVKLTLDDKTGSMISLVDKARNREYIQPGKALPPFRVALAGEMETRDFDFSLTGGEDGAKLTWRFDEGELRATVTLLEDGVAFRAAFANKEATFVRSFEYPIIGCLADYGDEGYLAHSYATGLLMQNPASFMQESGGLRYAPYPEAFSGPAMQFFTYYQQGKGGLYFAALDGDAHQKWLNTFTEQGGLVASHMAGFENAVPGAAIEMDYDFVVRFTAGEGWEEGAEMYKPWALAQSWCRRGRADKRREKATWLLEDAGLCTFGINAGHDRRKWMRRYREDVDTRVFHVLGPDWTNTPQTFGWGVPGDMEDWVPTKFNKENLDDIKENGDFFAPFEFDFMVAMDKSNPDKLRPHLQKFPKPPFSHDAYHFNMLCPCDPFTKDFHREKNLTMLRESGMDATYYDISANNLIKVCLADNHGHHPGGGHEITRGYQDVYQDTHEALSQEADKYIPLGTEMMNETFLSHLDFYQARAWGQPSSTLETWPFRDQMRSGQARMIPMFDYVYHEMGVVRMDGWGKLVEETGELFYHNAAKVYLWGGLYEINHEYSPMEELDGEENTGEEHYARFDPQHNPYSPRRANYLKAFAHARTGLANPYWAYGKMTVAPKMEIPAVMMDWYHYNHGKNDPSYKARGEIAVPAVIATAYESGDGGYALFLANAHKEDHTLSCTLDYEALRLDGGVKKVSLITGFQDAPTTTDLGVLRPGETLDVSLALASHGLYMLEIK